MLKIIKKDNSIYENIEPFYLDENGDKVWNIPQDVPTLQAMLIETVKWQAGHVLKTTDWAVTKCVELGLNITTKYPSIASERSGVRDWSNAKEAEILACSTLDELIALDIKL